MKKIAAVLIDYGMDFQYDCFHSQGEKITAYELGLEIWNQNGKIFYRCGPETLELPEEDACFGLISNKVEEECINETT
ncbi:hypothetical protein SAMN05216480_10517 [Pustulibacterium marinum]|uniref:Uncharacterized protein n=1 Tax=Pustulibacterium marinum TaxID=1224947 RepID=A0A1I7GK38_9FLAO|nr:hypothetical protein [Pustulibacterium marinum]SFU48788.1 hypothetical protein SAMN05216480_10517 [Pustulibacterium marinum]